YLRRRAVTLQGHRGPAAKLCRWPAMTLQQNYFRTMTSPGVFAAWVAVPSGAPVVTGMDLSSVAEKLRERTGRDMMTVMQNGERGPGSPRHRIGEKILAAADKLVTPRRGGPAPGGRKPWTRRHPVLSRVILIAGVLAVAVALAVALASGS